MIPSRSLPQFSFRDAQRLGHAAELLDAANQVVMQLNVPTKGAISRLLYEAQQEVYEVAAKVQRAMQSWDDRHPSPAPAGPHNGSAE